jgi:hypothetical protein
MTAAPVSATCTAQVTDETNTWACTSHFAGWHVADLGPTGGMRLWLDPDDRGFAPWEAPTLTRVRAAVGDDMAPDAAARLEALASATITLRNHRWLGMRPDDLDTHQCSCGWSGADHERHIADQLYATGALDRDSAPVVRVVRAATAMVERIGPVRRLSTKEAGELVAAVTALGGGS